MMQTPKQIAEEAYKDLPAIIKQNVTVEVYCVAFMQGWMSRTEHQIKAITEAFERNTT